MIPGIDIFYIFNGKEYITVEQYDKEIKEIGDSPVYLTYTYGATNFLTERSAVQYCADDIYNALVKNKIIFEVDYDRY